MRAKPVDLPPPNLVLRPKIEMFSSLLLRFTASLALMSVLDTLESPGWMSSMTYKRDTLLAAFIEFTLTYALSSAEKRVLQEFTSV